MACSLYTYVYPANGNLVDYYYYHGDPNTHPTPDPNSNGYMVVYPAPHSNAGADDPDSARRDANAGSRSHVLRRHQR